MVQENGDLNAYKQALKLSVCFAYFLLSYICHNQLYVIILHIHSTNKEDTLCSEFIALLIITENRGDEALWLSLISDAVYCYILVTRNIVIVD
jgi:hypothetical protein